MRSFTRDAIATSVQKKVFQSVHGGKPVNSFEPWNEPKRQITPEGQLFVNDLCYGTMFPQSYFDIRYPNENTQERRPTLIYFHGGGFLFGDKSGGDPLAVGKNGVSAMLAEICTHGYNIVSANYAFATKYRFPVQISQVNQLLMHLQEHSEYGLDMDRVVIMGSSAGADLTAIYGLAVADHDYAMALGITPCIRMDQVKALVIDEFILNGAHMDKGLQILSSGWIGERDLVNSKKAKLANIMNHIDVKFPPAFLIASNVEPAFALDAQELFRVLQDRNLTAQLYYRTQEESEPLAHGFLANLGSCQYSAECFEAMMRFLQFELQH